MDEDLLQYIWSQKCFGKKLISDEGEQIHIIQTGRWNQDAGPDFLNAKIEIGENTWVGHVEVHVRSSDWYAHQHEEDPNYEATILHVVWERNGDKLHIPTLELKDIISPSLLEKYRNLRDRKSTLACEGFTFSFPQIKWSSFRDRLVADRMQRKLADFMRDLSDSQFDWPELFYRKIARSLGQKKNGIAMQTLAENLPMSILAKHKNNLDQLEALYFGVSGLIPHDSNDAYIEFLRSESNHLLRKYDLQPMPITHWNMGGLRPANFPTIRIAQLAALVSKSSHLFSAILEIPDIESAKALFEVEASTYWNEHYTFGRQAKRNQVKRIGASAIDGIFINTIIPLLWAYGYNHGDTTLQERMITWMESIRPESNTKLKTLATVNLSNKNAMESQALLELYDQYCTPRHCLQCLIGREILGRP